MNTMDPAHLTLLASLVGALLFFCAGMVWNHRPAQDPLAAPPDPQQAPPRFANFQAAPQASSSLNLRSKVESRAASRAMVPRRLRDNPIGSLSSLRAALEYLTAELHAQSTLVLDGDGLLYTEGRDAAGAGLRLAAALQATRAQSVLEEEPQAFQLGKLRFQKLPPSDSKLDAWVASTGAQRFATPMELKSVAAALRRELHI